MPGKALNRNRKEVRIAPYEDRGHRTGRPSRLTDVLIAEVTKSILRGATAVRAVVALGIPKDTYHGWLQKAVNDKRAGLDSQDSIYMRLVESIDQAESEFQNRKVAELDESGAIDPRNIWIMLEKRFPEEWGKKIDINTTIDQRVEVQVSIEDERERIARTLSILEAENRLALPGETGGGLGIIDAEVNEVDSNEAVPETSSVPPVQ